MDRHARIAALGLALLAGAVVPVALAAPKKPARPAKGATRPAPAPADKQPPTLHVRSLDLAQRTVLIEISGLSAAPAANLFTFTDERGRKFVATDCRCQPPFPSGTRACDLEIPDGYQKHRLVSLLLHKGGLHGKEIPADDYEVASVWAAAIANIDPDAGAP